MPRRDAWQSRIKAVEREYWAVRLAVDRLREVAKHDPTTLGDRAKQRDLIAASDALEGTYVTPT